MASTLTGANSMSQRNGLTGYGPVGTGSMRVKGTAAGTTSPISSLTLIVTACPPITGLWSRPLSADKCGAPGAALPAERCWGRAARSTEASTTSGGAPRRTDGQTGRRSGWTPRARSGLQIGTRTRAPICDRVTERHHAVGLLSRECRVQQRARKGEGRRDRPDFTGGSRGGAASDRFVSGTAMDRRVSGSGLAALP